MAGGPTTPELVAAVSEAGGLGTFGLTGMSAEAAAAAVRRACALTARPVAVNVLVAPPTPADPAGEDPRVALAPLRRELGMPGGARPRAASGEPGRADRGRLSRPARGSSASASAIRRSCGSWRRRRALR